VKAEITVILYKDQIKHLKSQGVWPVGFDESSAPLSKPLHGEGEGEEGVEESAAASRLAELTLENSEEDNDDASEIFENTNRFGKIIYF
jgi:hypothetical protein